MTRISLFFLFFMQLVYANTTGNEALLAAMQNGQTHELIEIVKSKKIDINRLYYLPKYDLFITPLVFSIRTNNKELFSLLLKNGADINQKDKQGYPPVYYALKTLEYTYLETLLQKGSVKSVQGKSLYYYVRVDFNFLAKIRVLKRYGVKVDDSIIKYYKRKYEKYKAILDKVKELPIEDLLKLEELPIVYKTIIKKENSKKTVLRSINHQLALLKSALAEL